jgi:uracil-DNA glycosylase
MGKPVVMGRPVVSDVVLIGQAPGDKEPILGRPFAWTAGKQMFKWFASIGVDEETFRSRVYMAAVCRCFPGKNPKGGDRVPSDEEIAACKPWLDREIEILQPRLILPVGRLAIAQFLGDVDLKDVIGKTHHLDGRDVIPLPHPSGASTWYKMAPGDRLTKKALALIGAHPAWRSLQ